MNVRAKKNSPVSDIDLERLLRDDYLLNVDQSAVWLGVSASTMNRWRSDGLGPRFVKLCGTARGAVRYRIGDVRAWVENRVVSSASEAMLLDGLARVSQDIESWAVPHPFIVRPHFVVDSAVADRETVLAVLGDPYVKVRWMTPATAFKTPWLRADRRSVLVGMYLNSGAGAGKAAALAASYARSLAQVPERLFGSHPDLTLAELALGGEQYPIEFVPPELP
jgi:predicted DNA-binding transcriptional regulator AlpA